MGLVLARREGERVVLHTSDGEVEITILQTFRSTSISVGIDAPPNVNIERVERPPGFVRRKQHRKSDRSRN